MTLDVEFRNMIQRELEKVLDSVSLEKKSRIKRAWSCENENDFLYGWHMGKSDDFCINQYFTRYHRVPNKEDKDEIQGILFLHSKDLRDKLQ